MWLVGLVIRRCHAAKTREERCAVWRPWSFTLVPLPD